MHDRLLTSFSAYLIAWTGVVLAHFTYVQSRTAWNGEPLAWDASNLWHPFYFSVVNATIIIIPALLFHLPTARRYGGTSSSIGRAIIALSIGVSLWGLGNLYWFMKNVAGTDAPYPSLADAGYLAVLPFAAFALWELSRVVGLGPRDWLWLPVALAVATPLNLWIMLPQGIGAGTFDTLLTTAISMTYIASDVVLLGMGLLVAVGARRASGGRFFAPVLAVFCSIMLLYIGDILFNYRIANDLFYNADISDLVYAGFVITSSLSACLFLRADVRASAANAVSDAAPEPAPVHDGPDGFELEPLDELATAICRGQERMMGQQAARKVVRGIDGMTVDAHTGLVSVADDAALDRMVREFRSLAGPLGDMTSWTAARPTLDRHPHIRIPSLEHRRNLSLASSGAG